MIRSKTIPYYFVMLLYIIYLLATATSGDMEKADSSIKSESKATTCQTIDRS